jgi:hypothetical protein
MVAVFPTTLGRIVGTVGDVFVAVPASIGNWVLWRFLGDKWSREAEENSQNRKARDACMGSIHKS